MAGLVRPSVQGTQKGLEAVGISCAIPPPLPTTLFAMPPKTHDSDAHRIPESATTTSSPSMLTPIVKDGVGEIAKMLVDV